MYKCNKCEKEFENPVIITERHGFDTSPHEEIPACPYCHGDFEELEQCRICGKWFLEDDLTSGVCDECIYSFDNDIEFCYTLGNEEEAIQKVEINGFIASVFTAEQINDILFHRLKECHQLMAVNCNDFIDSDKSWFADKIKELKNDRAGIQTASGNKPLGAFQN